VRVQISYLSGTTFVILTFPFRSFFATRGLSLCFTFLFLPFFFLSSMPRGRPNSHPSLSTLIFPSLGPPYFFLSDDSFPSSYIQHYRLYYYPHLSSESRHLLARLHYIYLYWPSWRSTNCLHFFYEFLALPSTFDLPSGESPTFFKCSLLALLLRFENFHNTYMSTRVCPFLCPTLSITALYSFS